MGAPPAPPPSPAPSVASAASSSAVSTYEDGTYWRSPVYNAHLVYARLEVAMCMHVY